MNGMIYLHPKFLTKQMRKISSCFVSPTRDTKHCALPTKTQTKPHM